MSKALVWLEPFLKAIQEEYRAPLPPFQKRPSTQEEIVWIKKQGAEDKFDTLKLKQRMIDAYDQGKAVMETYESSLGTILVLRKKNDRISKIHLETWWHGIRLLSPGKPVRIVMSRNPTPRQFPAKGLPVGPENINGGLTMPCNAQTVVVYRKEEATRVLLHELFHASCSDPYKRPIPYIEADCEAWAELVLCGLVAKGKQTLFWSHWNKQLQYAVDQATYSEVNHGVKNPSDYGWRYLQGRLDVWRQLGFLLPEPSHPLPSFSSLRLTLCEP